MVYIFRQYFIWGLMANLLTVILILLIATFDKNLNVFEQHLVLFFHYLWPVSTFVGMTLRTRLLKRRGEWLSLQCMGWPSDKLSMCGAGAALALGGLPFVLSALGWSQILGLESQAYSWVWQNGSAMRISDGLTLSAMGVLKGTASSGQLFPEFLLPLGTLLSSPLHGSEEIQLRVSRWFLIALLGWSATLINTDSKKRILLCSFAILCVVSTWKVPSSIVYSNLETVWIWGPGIALLVALYWSRSRM
jgi:hypothetical protein